MIEITAPAPLPVEYRRELKLLKVIGCCIALYVGYKMFDVGIAKFSGSVLEAWEEKFLFFSATLSCFFVYVSWKTRERNGILHVFGFAALALAMLAALWNYEWRWFAHASTCIIGMFILIVAAGALIELLERRA